MCSVISRIFAAKDQEGDFYNLDRLVSEECRKRIDKLREKYPDMEYEEIQDSIFSVCAIAKKEAFFDGFKTGLLLILECYEQII